jgi:toxin-antitoxin system PIN domain toxin
MSSGTIREERVALLDVNVLIALFDPNHVHHEVAHDWFADDRSSGWATCPITENGLIRVLSAAASTSATRPRDLIEGLRTFCRSGHHVWWDRTVSLRDQTLFDHASIGGSRQITDIYLLGLAKWMGGRLATFDQTIPLGAVVGATRDHLAVITPSSD